MRFFVGAQLGMFVLGFFSKQATEKGLLVGTAAAFLAVAYVATETDVAWPWYCGIGVGVSVLVTLIASRLIDGVQTEDLLPGYSDGLGAWLLRLGAGAITKCVAPTSGGGQYLLVLGGTLKHRGVEYTRQACLYLTRDEPPLTLVAGCGGLEALTLQFPRNFAAA